MNWTQWSSSSRKVPKIFVHHVSQGATLEEAWGKCIANSDIRDCNTADIIAAYIENRPVTGKEDWSLRFYVMLYSFIEGMGSQELKDFVEATPGSVGGDFRLQFERTMNLLALTSERANMSLFEPTRSTSLSGLDGYKDLFVGEEDSN